jgi:acyl-[acyl carrier protein]--UDP-N-acetylglucosamine O-acyltransferase
VVVHPFAVIGGEPQDLSFDSATKTGVRIGARTDPPSATLKAVRSWVTDNPPFVCIVNVVGSENE